MARTAWQVAVALVAVGLVSAGLAGCVPEADDPADEFGATSLVADPDSPLGVPALLGLEPEIRPETRVLEPAEAAGMRSVELLNAEACAPVPDRVPCEFRITFAGIPADIAVGSVLASDVTASAPNGLLATVTAIDGDVALATEASLGDAIAVGEFRFEETYSADDVVAQTLAEGVTVGAPPASTALGASGAGPLALGVAAPGSLKFNYKVAHAKVVEGVYADGHISFDLTCGAYGGLTWEEYLGIPVYPNGVAFWAKCGIVQTGSIKLTAEAGVTIKETIPIVKFDLPTITFFIGPVPVVLIPKVTVEATVDGKVAASMSVGASEHFTATAGIDCSADCKIISDFDHGFDTETSLNSGRLSVEAGFNVEEAIMIYGLVGPSITETPYLKLEAKPQGEKPLWCLYGGIKGAAGINVDFGYEHIRWGPEELVNKKIDLACAENQKPVFSDVADGIGYPGTTFPPVFSARAVDPEDGPLPISFRSNIDGELKTSSGGTGRPLDDMSIGKHTITATATDLDGATATVKFAFTVADGSPSIIMQVRDAAGNYSTANEVSGYVGGTAYVRLLASTPIPFTFALCEDVSWSGGLSVGQLSECDFAISLSKEGSFPLTATFTDNNGLKDTASVTAKVTKPPAVVPPGFSAIQAITNGTGSRLVPCTGGVVNRGETVTLIMYYNNYADAKVIPTYAWKFQSVSYAYTSPVTALNGADSSPTLATQRNYTFSSVVPADTTFTFTATAYNPSGQPVFTSTCQLVQQRIVG